jgi:hypothetical protein
MKREWLPFKLLLLGTLILFTLIPLTALHAAETSPSGQGETSAASEGKKKEPLQGAEEKPPEVEKENKKVPSGYPRSYIVPKGLCEGNEPAIKIER